MIAEKNKDYVSYKYVISRAVLNGTLTKPKTCPQCGRGGKINAHHDDYNKPLDIIWLCQGCHVRLHRGIPFDAPLKKPVKKIDQNNRKSISFGGTTIYLPLLEPLVCENRGLLIDSGTIDEHGYFEQPIDWVGILEKLTYREREIIKLRYGLDDGYTYTLSEIANIFKLTRERVRQIQRKALHKLRELPAMKCL